MDSGQLQTECFTLYAFAAGVIRCNKPHRSSPTYIMYTYIVHLPPLNHRYNHVCTYHIRRDFKPAEWISACPPTARFHQIMEPTSESTRTYVKGLGDVAILLPKLSEQVNEFVTTLTTVVDELVSYFGDNETTDDETPRKLCQEVLNAIVYSSALMDKVDAFAWNTRDKHRQSKVMESLQQESPQFEPMKEYVSQLQHSLGQAENSHTIFEKIGDNLRSLEGVLAAVYKTNKEGLKSTKATGAVLGATVGSAIGLAVLASPIALPAVEHYLHYLPLPSMERYLALPNYIVAVKVISVLILILSCAAVGTGIGTVTAGATRGHDKLENAIPALATFVPSITRLTGSIRSTISDLRLKLDSINKLAVDEVDSLILNSIFEKLNEFGNTCLVSRQELKKKKGLLENTIDKLLVS